MVSRCSLILRIRPTEKPECTNVLFNLNVTSTNSHCFLDRMCIFDYIILIVEMMLQQIEHQVITCVIWGGTLYSAEHLCGSVSVMCDSLWPHRQQEDRFPCSSLFPGACSNSYPLSQWCHPTILSSVTSFCLCLQSFPASGSFPVSWLFTSVGHSIGVSASASVFQWIFRTDFL